MNPAEWHIVQSRFRVSAPEPENIAPGEGRSTVRVAKPAAVSAGAAARAAAAQATRPIAAPSRRGSARDEALLTETLGFAGDPSRVVASIEQSVAELQSLFEADRSG